MNTENMAVLDATNDIAEDNFAMETCTARVHVSRKEAGSTVRKGHYTKREFRDFERETFNAVFTDSVRIGRYCGLCFGTLAEMLRHCKAKGITVDNAKEMLAIDNARKLIEADATLNKSTVVWDIDWQSVAA